VRRTGHGFVLTRCLHDAGFYRQAMAAKLLRFEPAEDDPSR
jgi:hypothetical protein